MSLLSKLTARFGRYALPNVTILLIAGQVVTYLTDRFKAGQGELNVLESIRLVPAKVLDGEVWRLLTFVFDPPLTNVLFAFFFWYLFYLMGTTLESVWGAFRYNIFLAVGYVATVVAAFIVFWLFPGTTAPASNAFLYGTVFLAFARLYPEFVLYLFFVLPVKIRWLAIVQWIFYGLTFIGGTWIERGMVVAAVANYLLFFGRDIWRDVKQGRRRMSHQARTLQSPGRIVHKCTVCGLTSDESPQTQFRYCSKCDGTLCYCPEHLQNHEHVVGREKQGAS